MNNNYDSTVDTLLHIKRVNELLGLAAAELIKRGIEHDTSKLESPEKELYDELTPLLKGSTYGSDEYKDFLVKLRPALDNHYAKNSHHPEHTYSKEIWRDVVGYEKYFQVSSIGRIKRKERIVKRGGPTGDLFLREKILKSHITPKGYERIRLQVNNKGVSYFIHTLVAKAFLENPPPNKTQVNHKDGNKLNNEISNLEWNTPSENLIHAYETGLRKGSVKYVVHCKELDITTFGTSKMETELRKSGYEKASSSAIWRCISSENENSTHLDLHFESYNIDEYNFLNSPVNGMNLFDVMEMFFDWMAASERHDDGHILKSIEVNKDRFDLTHQLESIFINTVDYLGYARETI